MDFEQALRICDGDQALDAAGRIGERKVCELALLVCRATFGLSEKFLLEPDRRQADLLMQLEHDLEGRTFPVTRAAELVYLCKARQRPLAAVMATIAEITTPHLTDWNAVRLPRMLWFCYVLIRPLRLIWKRLKK